MPRPSRARLALTAAAAAAVLALGAAAPAGADPADLRKRIQAVSDQIDQLEADQASTQDALEQARADLAAAQARYDQAAARLGPARERVAGAERRRDGLVAAAYMNGQVSPALNLFFARDPQDALEAAQSLDSVTRWQQDLLEQARTARTDLDLLVAQLDAARTDREAKLDAADSLYRQLGEKIAAERVLLASLKAKERAELAAIAAARAAAARKAAAEAAARLAAERKAAEERRSHHLPVTGSGDDEGGSGAGSAGAAAAIDYALAQVGKPYSFAATPPSSWDCSKLTAAAWARAGVDLYPYSHTQYAQVRHVPVSQMRPGDLIFYYSPIGHVGLYVGNGMMVHAPQTGKTVSLVPVRWGKVVGVGRPG